MSILAVLDLDLTSWFGGKLVCKIKFGRYIFRVVLLLLTAC